MPDLGLIHFIHTHTHTHTHTQRNIIWLIKKKRNTQWKKQSTWKEPFQISITQPTTTAVSAGILNPETF